MLTLFIVLWLLVGIGGWLYGFLKYLHLMEMDNAVYDLKLLEGKEAMKERLKTDVILKLLSLLLIPFWPICLLLMVVNTFRDLSYRKHFDADKCKK